MHANAITAVNLKDEACGSRRVGGTRPFHFCVTRAVDAVGRSVKYNYLVSTYPGRLKIPMSMMSRSELKPPDVNEERETNEKNKKVLESLSTPGHDRVVVTARSNFHDSRTRRSMTELGLKSTLYYILYHVGKANRLRRWDDTKFSYIYVLYIIYCEFKLLLMS